MAKKILVVDDDEAVLDYMQAKLGTRYDIVSTNDAEDVLQLARREHPDLIVCDIDMPEFDGGDVSAALNDDDELREIPVLFLTSLVSGKDVKGLQGQIGGRPAISKQAPVEQLVARIESLFRP